MAFKNWLGWFKDHPMAAKTGVLAVLLVLLYLLKPVLNLVMMTLFLTILMGQIALIVRKYLRIPVQVTIVAIYGGSIGALTYVITKYWHLGFNHLSKLFGSLIGFYGSNPETTVKSFKHVGFISPELQSQFLHLAQQLHVTQYLAGLPKVIGEHVGVWSKFGIDVLLAILLSFVITMELPALMRFNQHFYDSKFPQFFKIMFQLLHQFIQAFMIAIDTQLTVAIVNMVITTIGLAILGYHNLILLAIMVWVFSLIPVAGAFISFIPLAILGFANGGIYDVIGVLILLVVVHILEAYVVNPKIMSNRTQLPVAYTLVALILGDLYLGVWGLLLAVPIMTFVFDFLGVVKLPSESHVNDEFEALDSDHHQFNRRWRQLWHRKR